MAIEPDSAPNPAGYDAAAFYTDLCDVVERAWMHAPAARDPGDMRCTSDYARAGANRILELIGQAMAAGVITEMNYDDLAPEELNEAIEAADQLTEIVEDITGVDTGEHSDGNEPWKNAVVAGAEYARGSDFEHGIRWIRSCGIHRDGMTDAEARAFLDPAAWEGSPRPVEEVFEVVRRRRGPWHAAP